MLMGHRWAGERRGGAECGAVRCELLQRPALRPGLIVIRCKSELYLEGKPARSENRRTNRAISKGGWLWTSQGAGSANAWQWSEGLLQTHDRRNCVCTLGCSVWQFKNASNAPVRSPHPRIVITLLKFLAQGVCRVRFRYLI